MLSRKSGPSQIGATRQELIDSLNLTNKNKDFIFTELLNNLSEYLKPLGMQIKFNTLDEHWYISFEENITELTKANPFIGKPRLAATLFCIITSCIKNSGIGNMREITEMRKVKKIEKDLVELQNLGYISIEKDKSRIRLSPLIGYHLNFHKLLVKLALKST